MATPSYPASHVTGAVHHYVQCRGDANVYYLGTCEVTPQMVMTRYRQPIFNTQTGSSLPFQQTRDGESAMVAVLLTNFSKSAYARILLSGANAGLESAVGAETRWSRGGLSYGQEDFHIWQVNEHWFNPYYKTPGLEIGRYWPQVLVAHHDVVAAGTLGEKLLLVFDAQPLRIPTTSANQIVGNEHGFVLYSTNPADFPASVRVPQ